MTIGEVKKTARDLLKNKWEEPIKIYLLYLIISFLTGCVMGTIEVVNGRNYMISMTTDLVSICIICLFMLGIISFFIKFARGEQVTYKELFAHTSRFVSVLITYILMCIFVSLWTIVFIIPGIIAALSYSQTFYLMIDDPSLSGMDALRKSKELMKGHKCEYFLLCLSFIGWAFLAAMTFGIGFIFLLPYIALSQAVYYNNLVGNSKIERKRKEDEDIIKIY